jgi:hypothetical protein
VRITSIEPTVFYVRVNSTLRQWVRIRVANDGERQDAHLQMRTSDLREDIPLGAIAPGERSYDAWFPDLRQPMEVELGLQVGGKLHDERTTTWQPQRHWKVYLVHYAHHDMGYTDLPSNVLREYDGFMDQVLRYCEETERWPDEGARFRYQCEQAWSAVHYLENRPHEVAERLAHYVENGQVEVTALFGNQTLELCSTEELVRLLYPAFRLKREYGISVTSAEHNDIPGFPWGLASVLAGAGVRYFSPGVPLWYFGEGEERVHPLWDTKEALPLEVPAACWWEGPDGARVLLWSDLHGGEWQPYNYDQAVSELPGMLRQLQGAGYPYDMVSYTLRGGHRDNAPPAIRYAYLAREWNRRWAYPRLVNTTNTPFLRAFEKRWGHTLKTLRGDVPGTDYPVAATCTPTETAIDRNTHEWLTVAEKLAALASLCAKHDYPRATLDEAYRETFYYDLHCWGLSHVGGPAQDGHWSEKGNFAYRAAALAHDVMLKAGNAIVDQISCPDKSLYFTVFNALSHKRSDVVRVPLRTWSPCGSPMFWRAPEGDKEWPSLVSGRAIGRRIVDPPPSLLETPFEIVDAGTGERAPYQVSTLDDAQAAQRWAPERWALGAVDPRHLAEIVLLAEGLPQMGYRTYKVVPCERWPAFGDAGMQAKSVDVVESRYYRLALDPERGGVASLHDKELERELVDAEAGHPFGQLVVRSSETGEEEYLRVTDASIAESGPLYTTVRLRGGASCCPRVTIEVTLYHAIKRVDLCARILRDSTPMRELYLAFPFLVNRPRFRFEGTGSVIEPIRDQWPGSNTDYYAVQHWAHVGNGDWGVTWTPLDTPIAEFGGLWPGYVSGAHHGVRGPGYGHAFLRSGDLKRGHIYAMISYNNFRTNFVNVHPGEYVVRYAFSSHRGDWRTARAWQFGWNAANPALAVWMHGPQEGSLPASTSFCQIDAPNVMLLTFKQAEDGDGIVLRLIETAGKETTATVTVPSLSIQHAFETNLVEENERLLTSTSHAVQTTLTPYAMRTIRLRARPVVKRQTSGVKRET